MPIYGKSDYLSVVKRISATEASRTFSELLNRVRYRGDSFVVERAGEAICRIVPANLPKATTVRALAELLANAPKPDTEFEADVRKAIAEQSEVPKSPWES